MSEPKHEAPHYDEADQALNFTPSNPDEYAALEKKLVRKIDSRLMPVLIAMIVLKYVSYPMLPINAFNRCLFS
jgi:hypothetical protein